MSRATVQDTSAPKMMTSELIEFVNQWRDKPGNLIMVLHHVQEHFGYVPRKVAFEVADLLNVPLARIYGVITFYNFFKLTKPGRNRIQVCMGTACYLRGGEDLIPELEGMLGTGLNSITSDGEFSMEAVRCIGCCGLAPAMTINGTVYGKVQLKDLPKILAQYRKAS